MKPNAKPPATSRTATSTGKILLRFNLSPTFTFSQGKKTVTSHETRKDHRYNRADAIAVGAAKGTLMGQRIARNDLMGNSIIQSWRYQRRALQVTNV
jgi:hypothetical protein